MLVDMGVFPAESFNAVYGYFHNSYSYFNNMYILCNIYNIGNIDIPKIGLILYVLLPQSVED